MPKLQFGIGTLVLLITIACLVLALVVGGWFSSQAAQPTTATSVLSGRFIVNISEQESENTTSTSEIPNVVEIRFYPGYVVLIRDGDDGSMHPVEKLRWLRWRKTVDFNATGSHGTSSR
jgi:hypothetical protein